MLATRPCVLSHPLPPGQLSCSLETWESEVEGFWEAG